MLLCIVVRERKIGRSTRRPGDSTSVWTRFGPSTVRIGSPRRWGFANGQWLSTSLTRSVFWEICCFQSTGSLKSIFLCSFLVNYELLDLLNNQLHEDNLNLTWRMRKFYYVPLWKKGHIVLHLLVGQSVCRFVYRPSDVHSISFYLCTWMILNLVQWMPLESRWLGLILRSRGQRSRSKCWSWKKCCALNISWPLRLKVAKLGNVCSECG